MTESTASTSVSTGDSDVKALSVVRPPSFGRPIFGRLDAFNEKTDDCIHYVERMAFCFEANGIQDDGQKRATFLSRVGAKTYKLLRSLVAPSKPGDKSFQALCDALGKLHIPRPSATLQRLRFNSRVCQPGQPTSVFGSSLRELSEYCEFGESPGNMLRDRLVCDIADERIQRRLPAERELSFAKAWDIARAMEDPSKKADEIQSGCSSTGSQATMTEVQYVQKRIGKSLPCYRCERPSATEKVGESATFSFVSLPDDLVGTITAVAVFHIIPSSWIFCDHIL